MYSCVSLFLKNYNYFHLRCKWYISLCQCYISLCPFTVKCLEFSTGVFSQTTLPSLPHPTLLSYPWSKTLFRRKKISWESWHIIKILLSTQCFRAEKQFFIILLKSKILRKRWFLGLRNILPGESWRTPSSAFFILYIRRL